MSRGGRGTASSTGESLSGVAADGVQGGLGKKEWMTSCQEGLFRLDFNSCRRKKHVFWVGGDA